MSIPIKPTALIVALFLHGRPLVPSASTITAILHRHGRIEDAGSATHKPFERFERTAPDELWQMDYKGILPPGQGAATR